MENDLKIRVLSVETITVVDAFLSSNLKEGDPCFRYPLLEVYEVTIKKQIQPDSILDEISVKAINGAGVSADELSKISEQLAQALQKKYDHGGIAPEVKLSYALKGENHED